MPDEFTPLSALADLEDMGCDDVVKCIFNLTQTDLAILNALSEKNEKSAGDVAEAVGKDRSTAHRSLEKLVSCGLCYKERKSGKPRGYINVYRRIPEGRIYKKADENLDKCYARIKAVLKENIR
jgi:predicted transcriptional regulator